MTFERDDMADARELEEASVLDGLHKDSSDMRNAKFPIDVDFDVANHVPLIRKVVSIAQS